MKLRPLHDWAVVRQLDEDEVTAGGIYIPDAAKQKPAEGVVEAIGPGAYEERKRGRRKEGQKERKFIPTTVKPGDIVVYESYAGREVKVNGGERVLVRERDILGTLTGRPEPKRAPAAPLQLPRATTSRGSAPPAPRPITAVSVKKAAAVPAVAPARAAKKAEEKLAGNAAKKAAPKPKASGKAAKKGSKKKR